MSAEAASPTQKGSPAAPGGALPLAQLIETLESQRLQAEESTDYKSAMRLKKKLNALRTVEVESKLNDLGSVHQQDEELFFAMVATHQQNFDHLWAQKQLEHKLRSDDLISALKAKHEGQQRELYETLLRRRPGKFSAELLTLRKQQLHLARIGEYSKADSLKAKGDALEATEVEAAQAAAKEENKARFQQLLKKQQLDREALASKLQGEKHALQQAKSQDFARLKKRLRNAEAELRKEHARQTIETEKEVKRKRVIPATRAARLESLAESKTQTSRSLTMDFSGRFAASYGSGSRTSRDRDRDRDRLPALRQTEGRAGPRPIAKELARSGRGVGAGAGAGAGAGSGVDTGEGSWRS